MKSLQDLNLKNLNEKQLIKISLAVSIFGLFLLYVISVNNVPTKISIDEITKELSGEEIEVCGTVTSAFSSEKGTTFLKIKDGKEIDVVFFDYTAQGLNTYSIEKGNNICVEGTVTIYKQKVEIVGKGFERV